MSSKKVGAKYEKVPTSESELASHKVEWKEQELARKEQMHAHVDQTLPIEVYNVGADTMYNQVDNTYGENTHHDMDHIDSMSITRPWHYGLFVCCANMDSCLESYFCFYCQVSRQFNMLYHNEPAIHYPMCILVMFLDETVSNIVGCLLVWTLRQNIRKRFGISGSTLGDACTSFWCTPCATQQQLLELTSLGVFPGACCYAAAPLQPQMVEAMLTHLELILNTQNQ